MANQLSPAGVTAMTCALESIGTVSKSKVSRVFPGGRRALGEMAFDLPAALFGEFVFGDGGEEACGGPSFLVRSFSDPRPHQLDGVGGNSLSRRLTRALSTAWVSSAPPPSVAGAEEVLVGGERDEVDDHVRQARRIGREVGADGAHVGQPPGLQIGGEKIGEFVRPRSWARASKSTMMRQAAGQPLQECVEGSSIGLAGEELIPIDEVEERHRLAAERVDHMSIVDDLVVLAVGMDSPAGQRHQVAAADEHVEPVVIQAHTQAMPDQATV